MLVREWVINDKNQLLILDMRPKIEHQKARLLKSQTFDPHTYTKDKESTQQYKSMI